MHERLDENHNADDAMYFDGLIERQDGRASFDAQPGDVLAQHEHDDESAVEVETVAEHACANDPRRIGRVVPIGDAHAQRVDEHIGCPEYHRRLIVDTKAAHLVQHVGAPLLVDVLGLDPHRCAQRERVEQALVALEGRLELVERDVAGLVAVDGLEQHGEHVVDGLVDLERGCALHAALEHHAHLGVVETTVAIHVERLEQELHLGLLAAVDDHLEAVDELVKRERARLVLVQVAEESFGQKLLLEVKVGHEVLERHVQLHLVEALSAPHRLGELILEPREPLGVRAHARYALERGYELQTVDATRSRRYDGGKAIAELDVAADDVQIVAVDEHLAGERAALVELLHEPEHWRVVAVGRRRVHQLRQAARPLFERQRAIRVAIDELEEGTLQIALAK